MANLTSVKAEATSVETPVRRPNFYERQMALLSLQFANLANRTVEAMSDLKHQGEKYSDDYKFQNMQEFLEVFTHNLKTTGDDEDEFEPSITVLTKSKIEAKRISDEIVILNGCVGNHDLQIKAEWLLVLGGKFIAKNVRARNIMILSKSVTAETIKGFNIIMASDNPNVDTIVTKGDPLLAIPENDNVWDPEELDADLVGIEEFINELNEDDDESFSFVRIDEWGNTKVKSVKAGKKQSPAPVTEQNTIFEIPQESWDFLADKKNSVIEPIVKVCGGNPMSKKEMIAYLKGISSVSATLATTINDAILALKNQAADEEEEVVPQTEAAAPTETETDKELA